jgi:hypothetical protein
MIAAGSGCNKQSETTTPSPVVATDTFTGVIGPLGSASHTFTVTYSSAYTDASVTITSLKTVANGTAPSITIGVGFGTTSVGVCTKAAALTNGTAPLNTELPTTGGVFGPGTYCVQLFDNPDAPTVTEPLNYAISVKHY